MYSLGVGRGMVLMVVGAVGDLCRWGVCLGRYGRCFVKWG